MPSSIRPMLSIVCLAVPVWADFQADVDAYNRDDYATALREWRPLAERGTQLRRTTSGCYMPKGKASPKIMFTEIEALFSINFDADKMLVLHGSDGLVLERFPLHHVTPVTGGIADREQDGTVLCVCFLQGLPVPMGTSRPGSRHVGEDRKSR